MPAGLAAGASARLRLSLAPRPVAVWEVQRFSLAQHDWADTDEVRIEGRVSARSEAENSGRELQVEGLLTSIDPAAGTVMVRGLVISTRRPGLRVDCGPLSPRVGDRVEVRAVLAADRRTLEATRIICR